MALIGGLFHRVGTQRRGRGEQQRGRGGRRQRARGGGGGKAAGADPGRVYVRGAPRPERGPYGCVSGNDGGRLSYLLFLQNPTNIHLLTQGEHLTVGGSKKTVWQLDLMTGLTVLNTIEMPCGTFYKCWIETDENRPDVWPSFIIHASTIINPPH